MDKWWVPGLNIGFEHSFTHGVADFLTSVDTGDSSSVIEPSSPVLLSEHTAT